MQTATVAERPELLERAWEETIGSIPEYNHHGDVINAYWGRLCEERPEFQFYVLQDEEILARGHSLPTDSTHSPRPASGKISPTLGDGRGVLVTLVA